MAGENGKQAASQSALELDLGMTANAQTDPTKADLAYVELDVVVKDIDLQDGQTDENEVTTFASKTKEYEAGLSDAANVTLAANWAQGNNAHEALMAAKADGLTRAWRIKHKDGSMGRFLGFVRQYTYKAAAGGTIAATFMVRVSGAVKWDAAPAPAQGGQ